MINNYSLVVVNPGKKTTKQWNAGIPVKCH